MDGLAKLARQQQGTCSGLHEERRSEKLLFPAGEAGIWKLMPEAPKQHVPATTLPGFVLLCQPELDPVGAGPLFLDEQAGLCTLFERRVHAGRTIWERTDVGLAVVGRGDQWLGNQLPETIVHIDLRICRKTDNDQNKSHTATS